MGASPREGSGIPSLLGPPERRVLHLLGAHPGDCASSTTVLQSMKLGVDVNRHKEVIVKAISAVLLLLLKHFKLNHVYQVPAAPSFCPLGQGLRQCCSSSPKEQRPWPSNLLELCMNVLRHSPPAKAFYHRRKEGEVPRACLYFFLLLAV